MTSYLGAQGEFVRETVIRKSRFITRIIGVEGEEDAVAAIAAVRKKHSDATHNCYAYIADETGLCQRFSDDGEPSGTAGLPMLEVLKKAGAGKTLAVVTRYFGGVKLGASGLVGAYSGCVADALKEAGLKRFVESAVGTVTCPYPQAETVARAIAQAGGEVVGSEYSDEVATRFAVPLAGRETLDLSMGALTSKNVRITYTGTEFFGYDNTKTITL